MAEGINRTLTPLSVCCVVFGFCASPGNAAQTFYCGLLALLTFVLWSVVWVVKMANMKYTFLTVAYLLQDVVLITMVTCYRVKYVTCGAVVRDVLDNIGCADRSLGRIGVVVPHGRNRAACVVYSVAVVVVGVIAVSAYLVAACQPDQGWMRLVHENAWLFNVAAKAFTLYSAIMLLTMFTFLLYSVKQRLGFVRRAVQTDVDGKNIAWGDCAFVSTAFNFRWANLIRQNYHKELEAAFVRTYNAYRSLKKFFTVFLCLHFLMFIFSITFALYFSSLLHGDLRFHLVHTVSIVTQFVPIFICVLITYDIDRIQSEINGLHLKNGTRLSRPVNANVKKWFYESAAREAIFDCGYFEVDSSLFFTVFDFATLFIFSVLS